MVLANAIVDVMRPSTPQKAGLFKVTVWGKAPHDQTRIYQISAENQNFAAQQGINRFVNEMEALPKGN